MCEMPLDPPEVNEPTVIDVVAWINDAENQEELPPELEAAYGEALDGIANIWRKDAGTVAETRLDGWLSLETVLMVAVDIGWHAATEAIKAAQARAAHGGDADARP